MTEHHVAKLHGPPSLGGKLASELFPLVVSNMGKCIRRLVDEHQLQALFYLGDDVSDTEALQMLTGLRAWGNCTTLSVGMLHADSPTRLMKSADMVVKGPACAKTYIEYSSKRRRAAFARLGAV